MIFTKVTEIPGQKASIEQLSMMITRYDLARLHSRHLDIVEIACGSGIGLGYLANYAKSVVGGDIDEELISIAKTNNIEYSNVTVIELDAHNLPFNDNAFDVLIIFEAIYYLKDIKKFVQETLRVLKPKGKIVISTVNCLWHGFNPSPFSIKYYTPTELLDLFKNEKQLEYDLLLGFYDSPKGSNRIKSMIKKIAVKLNLIPKTMNGKKYLKWFFYGKLYNIPKVLNNEIAPMQVLKNIKNIKNEDVINYKQIYLVINLK
jgi:ubiquinone/menaquinone biosynthesis C-methylase UbiE